MAKQEKQKISLTELLQTQKREVTEEYEIDGKVVPITFRYPRLDEALPILQRMMTAQQTEDATPEASLLNIVEVMRDALTVVVVDGDGTPLDTDQADALISQVGSHHPAVVRASEMITGAVMGPGGAQAEGGDLDPDKFEEGVADAVFSSPRG